MPFAIAVNQNSVCGGIAHVKADIESSDDPCDMAKTECSRCTMQPIAFWFVAVTVNWVLCCEAAAFIIAETNHDAISSDEIRSVEIRSDEVRWDEWYESFL